MLLLILRRRRRRILSMSFWCPMRATTPRLFENEMKTQCDVIGFRVFIVSMSNGSRSAMVNRDFFCNFYVSLSLILCRKSIED